jgi:hypothetical protein
MHYSADPETMRELQVAARKAMRSSSLRAAADIVGCSKKTVSKILRGGNVSVATASKFMAAYGHRLRITTEKVS